jgi:hypothetical protein
LHVLEPGETLRLHHGASIIELTPCEPAHMQSDGLIGMTRLTDDFVVNGWIYLPLERPRRIHDEPSLRFTVGPDDTIDRG